MRVVTELGAPAWLQAGEGRSVLLTVAPGGTVTELDRGALSDLRAEREELVWRNAGAVRRATP